jgi:hypothetical protein
MSYAALGNVNTRGGLFGQTGRGGGVFSSEQRGFGAAPARRCPPLYGCVVGTDLWRYCNGEDVPPPAGMGESGGSSTFTKLLLLGVVGGAVYFLWL